MSKKFFTEEQQRELNSNPYVYKVSKSTLRVTKEFKQIFLAAYDSGERVQEIFERHGLPASLLSEKRIWSISYHIRSEYEKYGAVRDGFSAREKQSKFPKMLTKDQEIAELRNELEYVKQQLEFLKKIISLRNTQR